MPRFDQLDAGTLADLSAAAGVDALAAVTIPAYASKADIAALPTSGGHIILRESGCEGVFAWTPGDLSAKVPADPLQGLYIAPSSEPTGVSGAWVRVVPDNKYLGEWWGLGTYAGTSGETILNPILATLLPPGAHFRLPPCDITVSNEVRIKVEGVHFYGASRALSTIRLAVGVEKNTINVERSGVHVHSLRIVGAVSEISSGSPFAVMVSPEYSISRDMVNVEVEDSHVYGCRIESTSGVIFITVTNAEGVWRTHNCSAFDNDMACEYQAFSLFMCEDVHVFRNKIDLSFRTHSAYFNIRLCGAVRCKVYRNTIFGVGQEQSGVYAIAMVTGSYGGYRRRGLDCEITDNLIYDSYCPFYATEWDNTLRISGNVCINDSTTTESESMLLFAYPSGGAPGGLAEIGGRLLFEGNAGYGFANGFRIGGSIKDSRIIGNTVRGNANAANEGDTFALRLYFPSGEQFMRFEKNDVMLSQSGIYSPIDMAGTVAGQVYILLDNWLPERDPQLSARHIISASGEGLVITSQSDLGTTASAAPPAGTNRRHAYGDFAAHA